MMRIIYLLSVWFHITAATIWLGGMLFLVFVVVPWLRAGHQAQAGAFLRETGARFRSIGWTCFGLFALTGSFNLWVRGVRWSSFRDPSWLSSPFGHRVIEKLGIFLLILVISIVHDFIIGPRATRALEQDPRSKEAQRLRVWARSIGRLNVLLALMMVMLGVLLTRGG